MKMTIGEIEKFITDGYEYNRKAKQMCFDLLNDDAEFPAHSIDFDYKEEDAPSISSQWFGDDVADAYITKLYVENGILKVNLHAYYIGEDRNCVDLEDECNVDYLDILSYINDKRK